MTALIGGGFVQSIWCKWGAVGRERRFIGGLMHPTAPLRGLSGHVLSNLNCWASDLFGDPVLLRRERYKFGYLQ